jgi:hypothetical protein
MGRTAPQQPAGVHMGYLPGPSPKPCAALLLRMLLLRVCHLLLLVLTVLLRLTPAALQR